MLHAQQLERRLACTNNEAFMVLQRFDGPVLPAQIYDLFVDKG